MKLVVDVSISTIITIDSADNNLNQGAIQLKVEDYIM